MGDKRKAQGDRGNSKKKYKVNPAMIDPQTSGVYATCVRGREKRCAQELKELLQEAAEEMYGEKLTEGGDDDEKDSDDEEDGLSIEESLKREIEGMKNKTTIKKDPIRYIDLGCECVVFFKTRKPINPVDLVKKICKDATESRSKNTRFTQKLTPITNSVSASIEELEKLAKQVLAPVFHKEEGQEEHTFAINISKRNFNTLEKDEMIKTVAGCVGRPHKVDLKKYEKLILIECFKSNIGMSVVDEYDQYQKFNLQQIFDKNSGESTGESRVKSSKKENKNKEVKKETEESKEEEEPTKA